jgi:3-methyladenine DNA glycosylase/8-oxoguanine DNA glycosylase
MLLAAGVYGACLGAPDSGRLGGVSGAASGVVREWRPDRPLDLHRTLAPLRRGTGDPAYRVEADNAIWRATRTPDGPGTLRLAVRRGSGSVTAQAWGPGAGWLLDRIPRLCGEDDRCEGFVPTHPLLADTFARNPGWRITRSDALVEVLVPCILEQKVTGKEARASWRVLVRRFGEPAPGQVPAGLTVPPAPATWAQIPSWEWHKAGVEPARSKAVITACRHAGRLEQSLGLGTAVADQRLRALPGIGVWTSAECRQRALGDPDAVTVGDFHLPHLVGVALIGRRVDDDGMLELLAPYAGHRYRVTRLIELSGLRNPRFGPRLTIQDHRGH